MKNFMNAFKKRLTNYGFWASGLALIPVVMQMMGDYKMPGEYANLANAILAFIVAAGVVSNPTTETKWFLDDKENNK